MEAELAEQIKRWASELGFLACGITSADGIHPSEQTHLTQWLEAGYHGEMQYMEKNIDLRVQPSLLVPGAQSVICLAYNYFPNPSSTEIPTDLPPNNSLKVARYAWGEDYHRVVKDKVHLLMQRIADRAPNFQGRAFTDSAPVMERQLAQRAGLGWIGKNSLLLRKGTGSYFFLAEIICNISFPQDQPILTDHCGTCRACMDACPTQAIVQAQVVDSNRCISYQTIEKNSPSSLSVEQHQGWVYGCDICQEVCPWNRFAEPNEEPRFSPKNYAHADNSQWQHWTTHPNEFQALLKSTAAERTGHEKILLEAQRLLGNS